MSYFAPYLDETGIHMPTYAELLESLTVGYKAIFGQDVYLGEDTQDYQLLSLYARAWDDLQALILDTYNARNPDWATGVSLDHLMALAAISRYAASKSSVTLSLAGVPGATLPAGQLARDGRGYSWETQAAVTFDSEGKAEVQALCTTAGAIEAAAGSVTTMETPTGIWHSVTNPADALAGRNTETDAEARARRRSSVSLAAFSTKEAIHDALSDVEGVRFVRVYDNPTGETDANGLPPHSVCAVVSPWANAPEDLTDTVAATLYEQKAPGIATHGNTSAVYTDMYGAENTVRFSLAQTTGVAVALSLQTLAGWDVEVSEAAIRAAVADYINGLGIGEDLVVPMLYSVCYGAIGSSAPTFALYQVAVSYTGGTVTDRVSPPFDGRITVSANNISIAYVS